MADSCSEPHVERDRGVQTTEVDFVAQEAGLSGLGITFRPLVSQFTAHVEHASEWEPNATDDDGPPRGAIGHVIGPENHVVEINELARFAVAPVECTDAGAH